MFPPTALVYEFFTGGGYPGEQLPAGLAAEALGMLWALLTDLKRWGRVRTLTALNPGFEERVPGLNRTTLPADEVVCVSHDCHQEVYRFLLKRCDSVLIIAPETDGILARLTREAEKMGIPVLGSSSAAITIAGNKESCHKIFHEAMLPSPSTRSVSFDTISEEAVSMHLPFVIKPVDGAGSEGVCRVDCLSDLTAALAKVRQATSHDNILLQSFASGTHVSVSLLAVNNCCVPLSLNLQLMETALPFRYLGSQVPFDHPAGRCGVNLACSAVKLIPGLRGYVGVDLVLSSNSAQLIEINPRVTTSYIGLRKVSRFNVAGAIWDACIRGVLPAQVPVSGQTIIRKDDFNTWGMSDQFA